MKAKISIPIFLTAFFLLLNADAQIPNCDPSVPTYYVNLTGPNAFTTWTSPSIIRNGNCCGTTAPDLCILFVITTDSNSIGVIINICGGPLPNGGMYYQLDCGPYLVMPSSVCGDTAFISTPGVHYLTFCKPGSVANTFCITPISSQTPTGIMETSVSHSLLNRDFSGNYFLNLNLDSPLSFTLNVFSSDGKIVSERKYELVAGRHSLPLPVQEFSEGIYFVQLKSAENSITKKLVVTR